MTINSYEHSYDHYLNDITKIDQVTVFESGQIGPKVIILGAVHGNETAGSKGILRLIKAIEDKQITLKQGRLTLVPITNRLAYEKKHRSGDRNLNRNLYPKENPVDNEDQIANWLCPLLADNEILLDLHTFLAQGIPFALFGPRDNEQSVEPFKWAQQEEQIIKNLGVNRFVFGWLKTYHKAVSRRLANIEQTQQFEAPEILTDIRYGMGTSEYMRSCGGYAVTLECGQHDDPNAPNVAYRAILNTLATVGLIDEPVVTNVTNNNQANQCWEIYEVVDRYHEADDFEQVYKSFDPVVKGQHIGTRHNGEKILAPEDGCILFPSKGGPVGQEWMYFARTSERLK